MTSVAYTFLGDAEWFLESKICPFLGQGIRILDWTLCRAPVPVHATYRGANHYDETFRPRQICILKKII